MRGFTICTLANQSLRASALASSSPNSCPDRALIVRTVRSVDLRRRKCRSLDPGRGGEPAVLSARDGVNGTLGRSEATDVPFARSGGAGDGMFRGCFGYEKAPQPSRLGGFS